MNSRSYKQSAGVLLGLGLAFVALGSLAIYSVTFATFASVVLFAWLLLFAGFIQCGHAFYARGWEGFWLQLGVGLLSIVGGFLLMYDPAVGAISLTLLIALLLISQGILRIYLSLKKRFAHWKWVLFNGIAALILGILILLEWPSSGLYIIGLFVGIDLIFSGWALIMMSSSHKKVIQ